MNKRSVVEVKDVFESAEKHGRLKVLFWSPDDVRDNKQNNTNKKSKAPVYDCNWATLKFRMANGKELRLNNFKFGRVIAASGAKLSSYTDRDKAKNMTITFRKFVRDELLNSDYVVKDGTKEEKEESLKRLDEYIAANNEFIDALDILVDSYESICNEMKTAKNLPFNICKDKKTKKENITINSIRQTHRANPDDDDNPIKLETPLYRLKLTLNKEEPKEVGIYDWDNNVRAMVFKQMVYNLNKMKSADDKPPLAKVKTNGKLESLNVDNAPSFITYKSLLAGSLEFSDISISKSGFALTNRFKELYVRRHKPSASEPIFSTLDLEKMHIKGGEDDESDVEFIEEPSEKKAPKKELKKLTKIPKKQESDEEDAGSDEESAELLKSSKKQESDEEGPASELENSDLDD